LSDEREVRSGKARIRNETEMIIKFTQTKCVMAPGCTLAMSNEHELQGTIMYPQNRTPRWRATRRREVHRMNHQPGE